MSSHSQTSSSPSPTPAAAMQPSTLHTPINPSLPPPSELTSLALSPHPFPPPTSPPSLPPPPPPSPPKRPRPSSSLRALALTSLVEDLSHHNLSHSRVSPTSPFACALPLPLALSHLSALPDGVLVCAAVHAARLDAAHALAPDSAPCALLACVASGALAVARGNARALLAPLEACAGLDEGEALAYAQLVHVYLGEARVGISVAEFREFDEMLAEMVDGL